MAHFIPPQRSGTFIDRFRDLGVLGRSQTSDSTVENHTYQGLHQWNSPQDALVELVFVHGLCGHPQKSFSSSDDEQTFWPLWLIEDSEKNNQRLRIWTFGYPSERRDGTILVSHLNDHGSKLCEQLNIKTAGHASIIFIAHSLGGLVVKAAINHAKRSESFHELNQRIESVLFLATPHQRVTDATMLERIIRATSERPTLGDLDPNASVIESINTEFSRYSRHDVRIWSFFETLPMFDAQKVLLDKHAATMNCEEEHKIRLHANHLSVAKFANMQDPNYSDVKEVLINAVDAIADELANPEKAVQQWHTIADCFGIEEVERDELNDKLDSRIPNTCEWLFRKPAFEQWKSLEETADRPLSSQNMYGNSLAHLRQRRKTNNNTRFFWLNGAPGTGKSFIAAAVAEHLAEQNCSVYFLKHTDTPKHNVGSFLKSIAWQMSFRDVNLRRWMLDMIQHNRLDTDSSNHQVIWKQIFLGYIFTRRHPPQYWIIDGIDESRGGAEVIELLRKIPGHLQYRIFLTSRSNTTTQRQLALLQARTVTIEPKDSREDLRLYLQSKSHDLHAVPAEEIHQFIQKILDKSQGSFLWTDLVVRRLSETYTQERAQQVLATMPEEMYDFYAKILGEMTRQSSTDLTRSILCCVVCAIRPLTLKQLQEAIFLDIGQKVSRMDTTVQETCGHLLIVKQNHVQLSHDTVRNFLLSDRIQQDEKLRIFAIEKSSTHARLGSLCLTALKDNAANAARRPSIPSHTSKVVEATFYDYASIFFSEHIMKSGRPESDTPVTELIDFLNVNITYWIAYSARQGDLSRLINTGKNLKSFKESRIQFQPSPRSGLDLIEEWANDLIYVVTYFGRFLLEEPSTAHLVIPPLCPKQSAIFKQFGNPALGLEVIGSLANYWMDRISTTDISPNQCTTLACCEEYYAVGTRVGMIFLFDAATCQETCRILGSDAVMLLEFARNGKALLVSTKGYLTLYNCKRGDDELGDYHWQVPIEHEAKAMTILEDVDVCDIWTISAKQEAVIYDLHTGREKIRYQLKCPTLPTGYHICGGETKLLAVSYRNRELELRSLEDLPRPRYATISTNVRALAFNPMKNMLAIAAFASDLVILQLWNLQQRCSLPLDVAHLAVSNDGETLLASTNDGTVHIMKFETLEPISQIQGEDHQVVNLIFNFDDRRFLDIRRHLLNVWEPSALARRKDGEKSSDETSRGRTSYSTAPSGQIQAYLKSTKSRVTAMVAHESGRYVFCGKENGDVTVHETFNQGRAVDKLYAHNQSAVSFLEWHPKRKLLASCDRSSRILIYQIVFQEGRIAYGQREKWSVGQMILEKHLDIPVRQLTFSTDGNLLMISTDDSNLCCSLDGTLKNVDQPILSSKMDTQTHKWGTHPTLKKTLVKVTENFMYTLSWHEKSTEQPSLKEVGVDKIKNEHMAVNAKSVCFARFEGNIWVAYDSNPRTRPILWRLPENLNTTVHADRILTSLRVAVHNIKHLIGEYQSQLVFIDTSGWISCMRVDMVSHGQPKHHRHFPIPHHWQRPSQENLFLVTSLGDIVLAADDGIVIVKRGLTCQAH